MTEIKLSKKIFAFCRGLIVGGLDHPAIIFLFAFFAKMNIIYGRQRESLMR